MPKHFQVGDIVRLAPFSGSYQFGKGPFMIIEFDSDRIRYAYLGTLEGKQLYYQDSRIPFSRYITNLVRDEFLTAVKRAHAKA